MEQTIFEKIKSYLYSRDEVVTAYIFGSYTTEKVSSMSDIDIAVLLRDSVDNKEYGQIKLTITNDLIEQISFDRIDIVLLDIASPLLSHEVIKKGMLLFSKDETRRIEYTVNAIMQYLDTIFIRKVHDEILHEKIRSGKFGYFKGSHKYSIEKVRKGAPDTSAVK
ncbi:MAG: nucleotidyltransferase domain-containing protein [Nitrospirae bacterium]|nr:nucleotidyltransferase domain-containing protein [Nitrospirota bacterium]